MSRAWSPQSQAGDFASSRRGGLTSLQCAEIRAERSKPRPTPWTALAKRYGRCELDIRAAMYPSDKATVTEPEPAPSFRWDGAKEAYMVERYAMDGPYAVAVALGCSFAAVTGKAFRMGITKPRGWNRHDQAKAA